MSGPLHKLRGKELARRATRAGEANEHDEVAATLGAARLARCTILPAALPGRSAEAHLRGAPASLRESCESGCLAAAAPWPLLHGWAPIGLARGLQCASRNGARIPGGAGSGGCFGGSKQDCDGWWRLRAAEDDARQVQCSAVRVCRGNQGDFRAALVQAKYWVPAGPVHGP